MIKYIIFFLVFTAGIFIWIKSDTSPDLTDRVYVSKKRKWKKENLVIANYRHKTYKRNPRQKLDSKKRVEELKSKGKTKFKSLDEKNGDFLHMVASIPAPSFENNVLQASDIYITENEATNETRIYISYNKKGSKFLGAIQLITSKSYLSSGERKRKGRGKGSSISKYTEINLEQSVIFKDSDIHSLEVKGSFLYLAGGTNDTRFKSPAMLEIIPLIDGKIPDSFNSKRIDLPSFAATSVIKVKDKVFVSVGDRDGGIFEISQPERISEEVVHYSKLPHKFFPLFDARYLAYNDEYIFCVQGTDSGLWIKRRGSTVNTKYIPLDGAKIAESKSSIELSDKFAYIGLGDGGAYILSLSSFKVVNKIPQIETAKLNSELSVTNAVSSGFNEVYTADGEAGARVFQVTPEGELEKLATISFGRKNSVNSVRKFKEFIVFATGLGGVKIAKLHRSDQAQKKREHTYYNHLRKSIRNDD